MAGYADLEVIGRGASAVVYRARQVALDRLVALKVLAHPGSTEEELRRFRQECRAMGELSWHPHVVPVFDAGVTVDGLPFLAMEFMSGGSLGSVAVPLGLAELVRRGSEVASALDAAHGVGIVHRWRSPGFTDGVGVG